MGRIRTVKPDLFRHEALFEAERTTGLPLRLAFIGLFTVADREGRFRWKPRVLTLDVLPFDGLDFEAVLQGLAAHGFIQKYTVDGEPFGFIPSWRRHQVINNRESHSTLPSPPGEAMASPAVVQGDACTTRAPRVDDARPARHVRAQGEREREGEGEDVSDEAIASSSSAGLTGGRRRSEFPPCPYQAIVDAYHEALPDLPRVKVMTERRKTLMLRRWRWVLSSKLDDGTPRAETAEQAMGWFPRFFERATENDFVMGRIGRGKGHEGWRTDLEYLLSDGGLTQVMEKTGASA